MLRFGLLGCTALLTACSLTGMSKLPAKPPTDRLAACSTSRAAPVGDTLMVAPPLFLAGTIAQDAGDDGAAIGIVVGIGAALAFAISAATGYENASRCESYRAEMNWRALRTASSRPAAAPR